MCEFCEENEPLNAKAYVPRAENKIPIDAILSPLDRIKGFGNYGIRLYRENGLAFDNSKGYYNEGVVTINYCPMCGRKLNVASDET